MKSFGLQIESFLQLRSTREIILLFVLLFVLGFAFVVAIFFERTQSAITEKKALNVELNHALYALQNEITSQKNLNIQDTETIYKEITSMEEKIAQQEEQKRLALEKFGVYFLKELTEVNGLYGVKIAQENGQISLQAKGKYSAMLDFLRDLQTQPKLSLFAMQLYPSPTTRDLVLYVTLQIQGN